MAVFRVNANKNYTIMSNVHFRDKSLSLKAKGLLSQMLSLPENWDYTVAGLCAINKESKSAIQAALKELEDSGYLIRTRTQDDKGRFDYVYDIYEKPRHGEPRPENRLTDNPCTENPPQYNTNNKLLNNKILKDKVNKERVGVAKNNASNVINNNVERVSASRFSRPTLEEVKAYCEERGNGIDPEHFIDYYEANGWKVGKNSMKDWKAAVRNWEKRDGGFSPKKPKEEPEDNAWWADL